MNTPESQEGSRLEKKVDHQPVVLFTDGPPPAPAEESKPQEPTILFRDNNPTVVCPQTPPQVKILFDEAAILAPLPIKVETPQIILPGARIPHKIIVTADELRSISQLAHDPEVLGITTHLLSFNIETEEKITSWGTDLQAANNQLINDEKELVQYIVEIVKRHIIAILNTLEKLELTNQEKRGFVGLFKSRLTPERIRIQLDTVSATITTILTQLRTAYPTLSGLKLKLENNLARASKLGKNFDAAVVAGMFLMQYIQKLGGKIYDETKAQQLVQQLDKRVVELISTRTTIEIAMSGQALSVARIVRLVQCVEELFTEIPIFQNLCRVWTPTSTQVQDQQQLLIGRIKNGL